MGRRPLQNTPPRWPKMLKQELSANSRPHLAAAAAATLPTCDGGCDLWQRRLQPRQPARALPSTQLGLLFLLLSPCVLNCFVPKTTTLASSLSATSDGRALKLWAEGRLRCHCQVVEDVVAGTLHTRTKDL